MTDDIFDILCWHSCHKALNQMLAHAIHSPDCKIFFAMSSLRNGHVTASAHVISLRSRKCPKLNL